MSEIGLAIGTLILLSFLTLRWRSGRSSTARARRDRDARVSMQAMTELVTELAPTLRDTAMVTAPQSCADRGHVWASPCGKRVYIN